MWTSIRVQNFKGYEDTGEIPLKPLTFLIGPNSGGKSTLLQVFLLLRQTVESRDLTSTVISNGDYVELGAYQDYVFLNDKNRWVEMALTWVPPVTRERATFYSGVLQH
jgi:predicted ATPase